MNKTNHILFYCGLSLVLLASACHKFLDIKSDDKLVVPQTLTDMQALLDDAGTMNLRRTPAYGEVSADDYFLLPATLAPLGTVGMDLYLWRPIIYRYQNDWSVGYQPIYNCNVVLDRLKDIERNSTNASLWDRVKGAALFYRAYHELQLLGTFGHAYDPQASKSDLGIVLRRTSDFNVPSNRATVAECYAAILEGLEESLTLLPDQPQHVFRPSKAAVHALAARAHLYMRNYGKALEHSEQALALKSTLMDYNSDQDVNSMGASIPFKPFNKEVIFYTEMHPWYGMHSPLMACIDPELYASYKTNDLRRTGYFLPNGNNQRFKGSYSSHASSLFSGLATDELYLTRAECLAYLDRTEAAMDALNSLLKTRWRNTVSYPQMTASDRTDALAKIRTKRRKSLLMRGGRWMDIKRLNREGAGITPKRVIDGITYTLPPGSPMYALPLPTDIIEQTGMPQN